MKTLYIECNMGAAGDMITAALLELLPDPQAFLDQMNAAGIPGLAMSKTEKISCGVRGTHMIVKINGVEEISDDVPAHEGCGEDHNHVHHPACDHGHHSHAGLADVAEIVNGLKLPDAVKRDVMGVYGLIAGAEAFAHGCEIEKIHFHEVGMMDAVADVSAVCLLMHLLQIDRVVVSPLCTGFGEVRCMHGVVPVPAPATAYLLRGMPAYAGHVRGELLTPTGAALLKYFADEFGHMPLMRVERVGCGMGMKEFDCANCVRAMLGTDENGCESVMEICCNLDDMTGETIAFAAETLMNAGALDVYTAPIQMKKGRPGILLSCLCRIQDADRMSMLMLRNTTTLGVRMRRMERRTLDREVERVSTPYGEIRVKRSTGAGFVRRKPEYADAARIAREKGVSILEILASIEK